MKENKNLEFKSAVTNSFLKTVSAYSNFGEGMILFGVNDDGSVCGIKNLQQTCLDIENRINDSIIPKPDFSNRRYLPSYILLLLFLSEVLLEI